MNPLSAAFGALVRTRNSLYDRGVFFAETLQWPVISVGNISVGGSGKTPFTVLLGQELQKRKLAFDVLSRGYKRKSSGVKLVDPDGLASEFGDEPILLAKKLHVPVIVGEDRAAAGRFAEKTFADLRPAHGDTWFHLLDDGFQHRRLARSFDIVLVSEEDLEDRLLPLGRLRESVTALSRADAIVVPEAMPEEKLQFGKPIWRVKRRLDLNGQKLPQRPVVIAGIAKPQRFLTDLRRAGIHPVAEAVYSDHHAYARSDIEHLADLRDKHNSEGFITTEKDAINLQPHHAALAPIVRIPLIMELHDAERCLDTMFAVIRQRLSLH
ncbi:MAG TPA: tetraacyldisaccharide 4'-kinase [Terriglobales bacterium]|nr:tetraacyldisaccharide 4'-kinase [Terriglobales bacterium]